MDNEKDFELENEAEGEEKSSKNKAGKIIISIIGILMIIAGSILFGYHLYNEKVARDNAEQISSIANTTSSSKENPIDFASLQAQNEDIYAWIKIPDTEVDYPMCQSKEDDFFYLRHSALDKSWSAAGAIYTESWNTTKFTDRVTVVYGHNGYDDTMFTTLHKFEDEDFFNEHPYYYVYTPDSILTYQVISAFKYDNRHILNSFELRDDDVFEGFIEMIRNPSSSKKNVRTDLDLKDITIKNKIMVLSTCITNQKSSRYLVCGVLIKNEKTN